METGPSWLVLGFDARELPRRIAGAWTPERKNAFLYRLDVDSPLSVDRMVWPSIFERLPELLPGWTGRVDGLWEDLSRLRATLRDVDDRDLIAFAIERADCSRQAEEALEEYLRGVTPEGKPGPRPEPHEIAQPHTIDSTWEWLGCDVSDFFGVSALSNAGFLPEIEDVDALRREWGTRLNQKHLFNHVADANAFKTFADQRVSEHSPFFTIGLWRIPV